MKNGSSSTAPSSTGTTAHTPSWQSSSWRLTPRGRVVVAVLIGLLLAVPGWFIGVNRAQADVSGPRFDVVVVQPGETLWQIAQRVSPDEDRRSVVHQLLRDNTVAPSGMQPGQKLFIRQTSR